MAKCKIVFEDLPDKFEWYMEGYNHVLKVGDFLIEIRPSETMIERLEEGDTKWWYSFRFNELEFCGLDVGIDAGSKIIGQPREFDTPEEAKVMIEDWIWDHIK